MTTNTNLPAGTFVRDIGHSVNVRHGAIGRVKGYHHILTDCPVVEFPNPGDTFGPYSSFVITRADDELEPLDPADVVVTDSGRYVYDPTF